MLYPTELQAHQELTIHQWPRGLSHSRGKGKQGGENAERKQNKRPHPRRFLAPKNAAPASSAW